MDYQTPPPGFDFEIDEDNINNNYEITPPPGFDFEIVDIVDGDDNKSDNNDSDKDSKNNDDTQNNKTKTEYFPLFSNSEQIKIELNNQDEIDNDNDDDYIISNDITNLPSNKYDEIVNNHNSLIKSKKSYFQQSHDLRVNQVAVSGDEIYEWVNKFKILTNYRLIDLNKFNKQIDDWNSVSINKTTKIKKRIRGGKKKREARIFRRERIAEWNKNLELARERSKKLSKERLMNKKSSKVKFGDSFKRSNNNRLSNKSSSTNKFRTE